MAEIEKIIMPKCESEVVLMKLIAWLKDEKEAYKSGAMMSMNDAVYGELWTKRLLKKIQDLKEER